MNRGSERSFAAAPLIERLEDDAPEVSSEPHPLRVASLRELRHSVRTELVRLLNTRSSVPWDAWLDRPRTVLDYGIPDFTWMSPASQPDRTRLAQMVEQCIAAFEPRLARVRVRASPIDNTRSFRLLIEARLVVELVNEPVTLAMVVRGDGAVTHEEGADG